MQHLVTFQVVVDDNEDDPMDRDEVLDEARQMISQSDFEPVSVEKI